MKVSIMLKPRKTGITEALKGEYLSFNYNRFNGEINRNLIIDRTPIDKVEELYKYLTNLEGDYKVIIATSVKNNISELERIESLFINNY